MELHRKAAAQGDARGQYQFARYFSGCGRREQVDFVKAAVYFEKSARQGHDEAQYSLAFCFAEGEGVAQDTAKAADW